MIEIRELSDHTLHVAGVEEACVTGNCVHLSYNNNSGHRPGTSIH